MSPRSLMQVGSSHTHPLWIILKGRLLTQDSTYVTSPGANHNVVGSFSSIQRLSRVLRAEEKDLPVTRKSGDNLRVPSVASHHVLRRPPAVLGVPGDNGPEDGSDDATAYRPLLFATQFRGIDSGDIN